MAEARDTDPVTGPAADPVTDPDAPWLDPDELRAFLALRAVMLHLDPVLDAQLRRDAGLSHFDYTVLAMLSEAPERTLRMSRLAVLADGSLPRLSQVVSRLEAKDWVRRTPDPSDGRFTLAILTDEGHGKVVASAPAHVREVRRLVFDPLTKAQVKQLTSIGTRIMRAIDPNERGFEDHPPAD